jgi:hypothetical protein
LDNLLDNLNSFNFDENIYKDYYDKYKQENKSELVKSLIMTNKTNEISNTNENYINLNDEKEYLEKLHSNNNLNYLNENKSIISNDNIIIDGENNINDISDKIKVDLINENN